MNPTTNQSTTACRREQLHRLREEHHAGCSVCGQDAHQGLKLDFSVCEDGSVESQLVCDSTREGYPDMVHGGVIASLLDGAMTHCLFAHGTVGVTGEFKMKILRAVASNQVLRIRAWLDKARAPLYLLAAEIHQEGRVVARSTAKFMDMKFLKPPVYSIKR